MFLFPVILPAQINESDTLDVKAGLTVTGFWQAGNVETLIFRSRSDLSVRFLTNWVFKNQNSYVYQAFGRQKADEDILSLNFLYLNPDKKIYPLLLGFFSTNYRREIDLRYLLGAGVTFQLIEDDSHWLKVSLSTEYEQTDFGQTDFNLSEYDGRRTIDTFRGTIWVNGKYRFLDEQVILTHESYYQPSLEHKNNYRWQANVGLEIPIREFISFRVNYSQTFESLVINGEKQEDRFLTYGFTIKNY